MIELTPRTIRNEGNQGSTETMKGSFLGFRFIVGGSRKRF
jgi:hypothetical protein